MAIESFPFEFDAVAVKKSETGEYIGLIDAAGFTLEFRDSHGTPIPLNRQRVDELLKGGVMDAAGFTLEFRYSHGTPHSIE